MKVPLLDLAPQTSGLREEIVAAVCGVIDSNQYVFGDKLVLFEENVAAYCGSAHGVGVSSGTDALLVSLMALGVGPGDLVVTTPFTFFATVGAIVRVGAKPFFVDIEEDSFNIDCNCLAEILEHKGKRARIKAILPVHLFGQMADMEKIKALASSYNIPVIEDGAQAIGACCPMSDDDGCMSWHKAGSIGELGCFSFFPSKNLGGIGDGGLVTVNSDKLVNTVRSLRNHGESRRYYHDMVGGNFRLDAIQAVVLDIKLKQLDKWHNSRRLNAARYRQLFSEAGLGGERVILPVEVYASVDNSGNNLHHIYNQFVVRAEKRDKLQQFLLGNDIGCAVYYPVCLHKQDCFAEYNKLSFPVAEKAAREVIALPIYPELAPEQQEFVVENIDQFYKKY